MVRLTLPCFWPSAVELLALDTLISKSSCSQALDKCHCKRKNKGVWTLQQHPSSCVSCGQQDFRAGFHLCGGYSKLPESPELLSRIFQESCWRNMKPNNKSYLLYISNITSNNLNGCWCSGSQVVYFAFYFSHSYCPTVCSRGIQFSMLPPKYRALVLLVFLVTVCMKMGQQGEEGVWPELSWLSLVMRSFRWSYLMMEA